MAVAENAGYEKPEVTFVEFGPGDMGWLVVTSDKNEDGRIDEGD